MVSDLGMSMILTGVTTAAVQYLLQNQTADDITNGYSCRFAAMMGVVEHHPFTPSSYNPYQVLPTWDNESGKQDRIDLGADDRGQHEYLRLPTGKVVEDTIGWLLHAPDTFVKKMSPVAKSATQAVMNDKGYGVPVEDPDGNTLQHIAQGIEHVIEAQVPYDSLRTIYDVTSGHGTALDKAKTVGFVTGFSASQGNPQGPLAAEEYEVSDRIKYSKAFAMEVVKRDLKYGNEDAARDRLEKIGLTPHEINNVIRKIDNPKEGMTGQQRRYFNQHANDDERARMNTLSH